jgi:hypothetical protein
MPVKKLQCKDLFQETLRKHLKNAIAVQFAALLCLNNCQQIESTGRSCYMMAAHMFDADPQLVSGCHSSRNAGC